ncbi:MAG TPA: hypothetical protein VFU05_20710 [Cyclobacteriaceae bacterium]|nr:hypothetical protein [Cyclobacteriaceae bacterium]
MKKLLVVSFFACALLLNCGGKREEVAYYDSATSTYDTIASLANSAVADTTAVGSVDFEDVDGDNENLSSEPAPILIDSPAKEPVPSPPQEPTKADDPPPVEAQQTKTEQQDQPAQVKNPDVRQLQVQSAIAVPRKIYYVQQKRGTYENEPIDIKIVLWDNENRRVRADKNYRIAISVQLLDRTNRELVKSKRVERSDTVTIMEGQGEAVYHFVPRTAGIYGVMCSHPEMQPAEWKMNVMSKFKKIGYSESASQPTFMLASHRVVQTTPFILVSTQDEKVPLADGEDFADIEFLLVDPDDLLGDSVRIVIENSKGELSKNSLHVNKDYFVRTRLTSSSQGSVTLRFLSTDPHVMPNKEMIKINFAVPIDHFELSLAPSEINFFDLCQVIIFLKNKKGDIVATDRIIPGSFEILKGSGRFGSDTLKILSGKMQAQIHFQPSAAGIMTIRAHMPGLSSQTKEMLVTWPLLLIGLATGFGLAGSFSAHKRKPTKWKWMTICSGAITGLILYWMVVFFNPILGTPVSQATALNPVTAVAFGMAGGFSGVEVLRLVLKKFFNMDV